MSDLGTNSDIAEDRGRQAVDQIAREIVKRQLETPAIMFLESVRPLAFAGGQLALAFFGPFLGVFTEEWPGYFDYFSRRENVDLLIKRIENLAREADEHRKAAKDLETLLRRRFSVQAQLPSDLTIREEEVFGDQYSGKIRIVGTDENKSNLTLIILLRSGEKNEVASANQLLEFTSAAGFQLKPLSTFHVHSTTLPAVPSVRGHRSSVLDAVIVKDSRATEKFNLTGFWCDKSKRNLVIAFLAKPRDIAPLDEPRIESFLRTFRCH